MIIYRGQRDSKTRACSVWRIDGNDCRELPPRLDLFRHSPTGFEWGYGGSGPAQLALALLADALADDAQAIRWHQKFKACVIAPLARDESWELSRADVVRIAYEISADAPAASTIWRLVLLLSIMLLAGMPAAEARIECRSSSPERLTEPWAWRVIDGKKCWYAGRRGMDKGNLYWRTEGNERPATAGARADDPHPAEPADEPVYVLPGISVAAEDAPVPVEAPAAAANPDVDRGAKGDLAEVSRPLAPLSSSAPRSDLMQVTIIVLLAVSGVCLLGLSWLIGRDATQ